MPGTEPNIIRFEGDREYLARTHRQVREVTYSSANPGLHLVRTISSGETTGRSGSMFQVGLFGWTSRAQVQWHRNWSFMPGVSADGSSFRTSAQASSPAVGDDTWRPFGVGAICRLGPTSVSTHVADSM